MVRYEQCSTPCPVEMPCIHDACPYYRVEVCYCDQCKGLIPASYEYEGKHYCGDCLDDELDNEFRSLSVEEKIEALMLEDEIRSV